MPASSASCHDNWEIMMYKALETTGCYQKLLKQNQVKRTQIISSQNSRMCGSECLRPGVLPEKGVAVVCSNGIHMMKKANRSMWRNDYIYSLSLHSCIVIGTDCVKR